MFFCYILECADRSFYVGVTEDPAQRVRHHNEGKGPKWTAARRPVKLVWTEEHSTLSSARGRENQLKHWSHAKKAALVGGSPRLRSGQTQVKNSSVCNSPRLHLPSRKRRATADVPVFDYVDQRLGFRPDTARTRHFFRHHEK